MLKRIKRIRSHTGHARYLTTLTMNPTGWIPRQASIPSPYAYSPVHAVWKQDDGRHVIVVETAHKVYDVFAMPGQRFTEAWATDLYLDEVRRERESVDAAREYRNATTSD